ncbi:sensor histidine kinase [Candidatus Gracilibacteria bacterium]|nr:sensor histidine kinase [Candidatus Gracilibacteria bacterium]NJM88917.1 sensor histidine kinase [Hydrococcus sp. RU_2_2]NJP20695.1 sensor histidine kinase [Hydrococcus sp. CRU_1_1]
MNENKILKEELKKTQLAYQMATQINQFKTGFLARSAHELRRPLSNLIALHQIILSDLCENPLEERDFIDQAYQSAQKLLKILDDLIAVSKIEYGNVSLEIRPIGLSQVVGEVRQLLYLQAENRSLHLDISLPQPDVYVMADFQRLVQVLLTIVDTTISNAREGRICIVAHSSLEGQGCIEIDCPVDIWQESLDLLANFSKTNLEVKSTLKTLPEMSPAMRIQIAQTLLEAMGGSLQIAEASPDLTNDNSKRLQCLIPLALAEVVDRELSL